MRSTFALLAAALLSGCGLTDGPNRTGSSWLDDRDLGPQGLETVSIPLTATRIVTMLDPGVPALNGVGSFVIGDPDGLDLVSSVWFDPGDTSRWVRSRPKDSAAGDWKLEVRFASACPGTSDLSLQLWRGLADTLPFLLGADKGAPDTTLAARCTEGAIRTTLGDSNFVSYDSGAGFGVRFLAPGFEPRTVSAVLLINGVGDTLLHGLHASRGAWGSRWTRPAAGWLSSSVDAGSRLRIRFDGDALRGDLFTRLGLDAAASDSFDNTVAIFSARAVSTVSDISAKTARRFRLASWVVQSRDTTWLPVPAVGKEERKAFKSRRASDGSEIEGTFSAFSIADGVVGICLHDQGDTISFVTMAGDAQNRFHLFPGDSIEATLYVGQSWMKLGFHHKDGRILFTRAILSDPVSADDQATVYENGAFVYREEAISRSRGPVTYEARSAFQRIVNRKAQEVWTDLYDVPMDSSDLVESNARITLAANPVQSVTFQVRRRSQGVVQ